MKAAFAGSGAPGLAKAIRAVERRLKRPHAVMRVMSVDPGTITGISVFWVNRKSFKVSAWAETLITHDEHQQVSDLLDFVRMLSDCGPVHLIIENFRVQRVAMEETFLSPVRIGRPLEWGVLERNAGADGITPYFHKVEIFWVWNTEMAGMRDERLKALGFYTPGPDHRRDATRHLLLHLRFAKEGNRKWVNKDLSYPPNSWDPGALYVHHKVQLSAASG